MWAFFSSSALLSRGRLGEGGEVGSSRAGACYMAEVKWQGQGGIEIMHEASKLDQEEKAGRSWGTEVNRGVSAAEVNCKSGSSRAVALKTSVCPKYLSCTFCVGKSSCSAKQSIHFVFWREKYHQCVAFRALSTRDGILEFIGFAAKYVWHGLTRTTSDLLPQLTLPQFICLFRRKENC